MGKLEGGTGGEKERERERERRGTGGGELAKRVVAGSDH